MGRSFPGWVWAVLVFLLVAAVRERTSETPTAEVRALARGLRVERDPRRMSARELRQLPGVGHKLALALAHARDCHRGPVDLDWEDVPGIGPVRAREIRAWCLAEGIDPDPLHERTRVSTADPESYPVGVPTLARMLSLAVVALLTGCRDSRGGSTALAPDSPPLAGEPALRARTLALQGGALHALEAGPGAGLPVLLLHGARFSARTWEELGTLAHLARAGHHALAIDWPGYGATPAWDSEPDAATLLESVRDELGAERVVLVAPSLGGAFAFEFVGHSAERVAALVAIAPAGTEGLASGAWSTPTLLLWGERDEVVPLSRGRELAERLKARLEIFPGAAHACYLDQPERFHALLLEFLASLAPRGELRPNGR